MLTMLPSEYFRRQCWISFDPDEAMLAYHGQVAAVSVPIASSGRRTTRTPTPSSPASPRSSTEALERPHVRAEAAITSESALALYGIG